MTKHSRSRATITLAAMFLSMSGAAEAQQKVYFRAQSANATAAAIVANYGGTHMTAAGDAFSIPAAAPVGGVAPYQFNLDGALPSGLIHAGGGAIAGTAQAAGTFDMTFEIVDASASRTSGTLRIVVTPALAQTISLDLTPTPPTEAMVGQSYSGTFSITGGTAPYSLAQVGWVPAGLTVNGQALSGVFNAPGNFVYGIEASDSQGTPARDTVDFSTIVYPSFSARLDTSPETSAATGQDIAPVSILASGGKEPYSYGNSGTLPPGLSIVDGVLSGKPTASGSYSFKLTAAQALPGVPAWESDSHTIAVLAAADRSLLSSATYIPGAGDRDYFWIRVPSGPSSSSGYTPASPSQMLEVARSTDAANSTSGVRRSNSRGTQGPVGLKLVYQFSEDVIASRIDQDITIASPDFCPQSVHSVVYTGSLTGAPGSYSTLVSIPNIAAHSPRKDQGSSLASVHPINGQFTPTKVRFVEVSLLGTPCIGGGGNEIGVGSGIVK